MRFTRVVSLIAGIVLLVTGFADVVGRRADVRDARDQRLTTAAALAAARLDGAVARAAAVLTVAGEDTSVTDLGAALSLPACVVTASGHVCSIDPGVAPDDAAVLQVLAAASTDAAPAAAVVVAPPGGAGVAVVVGVVGGLGGHGGQGGDRAAASDPTARQRYAVVSVDPATTDAAGGTLTGAALMVSAGRRLLRPTTTGTEREVLAPVVTELAGGPWALRATVAAAVTLTAGERALIGAQAAIGAALALLALGGLVREHRALQRRASTDALTRLPNRAEFERRANAALHRLGRDGGGACLMLIDLDQFKVINDTVGHDAGDRVLVEAAQRLRGAVRDTDLVGRWGGDEFVVLLLDVTDPAAIPERAAAIAGALADTPAVGAHELTASVGAALFPLHGGALDALLRAADQAMYAAKPAPATGAGSYDGGRVDHGAAEPPVA